MFADVSGFTALSEKLDPEDVTHLMNRVFETLSDIVDRYEGHIDKYIGDALMVLFGAPTAHEDDPLRAVLCALDMMEAMKNFEGLELSIGIHFGKVYAGGVGSHLKRDYTVMGDTVNLAQRLQAAAGKGEIYVSESVYEATRSEIEYEDGGIIRVKGKEQPVRVYIPVNVKARRLLRRLEGTPFVDREKEFGELLRWFEDVRAKKGGVVGVIGDAGIGKTKLVRNFLEYIGQQPVRILEAHGVEYLKDVKYFMLKQILQRLMGFEDTDPKHTVGERIESFFKTPERKEFLPLVPFLKYLFSVPLPEKERYPVESMKREDREHILNRWLGLLFERISEKCPLVLVLDDLQWADGETLRFCVEFAPRVGNQKVMLLFTSRPEFWKGDPERAFWMDRLVCLPVYREIRLLPLEAGDGLELARKVLGCEVLEPELEALLLERSGGNPFYIEELVSALVQGGWVKVEEGVGRLVGENADVVPVKVEELVLSRMDRLPSSWKEVLSVASVMGTEFSSRVLVEVLSSVSTERDLEGLEREGWIHPVSISAGLNDYVFRHGIVRDVVYASLPKTRRKAYHRKVLEGMEKVLEGKEEDFLEVLVHHAREGEEREKLLAYLERLGHREERMGRYDRAEAAYEEMMELLGEEAYTTERGVNGLLKLASVKRHLAKYDEGLEMLKKLEKNGRMLLLEERLIRLLILQSLILFDKRQLNKALMLAQKALQLGMETFGERHPDVVTCYDVIGRVYQLFGDYDTALRYLEKALHIALAIYGEDHPAVARSYNHIGLIYGDKGDVYTALQHFEKAFYILNKTLGERHPYVAACAGNIGQVYFMSGDHETALRYFEKAGQIFWETLGEHHPKVGTCYIQMGNVYAVKGDCNTALQYYEKALQIALEIFGERHPDLVLPYHNIGEMHYRKGDYNTALRYFTKALQVGRETLGDDHPFTLETAFHLARTLLALRQRDQALEFLKQAVEKGRRLSEEKRLRWTWLDEAQQLLETLVPSS